MKTIIFYLLLPSGQGNIVTDRPLVGQIVMHWEVGTFWKLCKPPLHCYAIFLIKRIQLHNIFCSSNRTILAAKVSKGSKDVFKILFLLLLRTLKLPKNQSLHWCELKCLLCSFFFGGATLPGRKCYVFMARSNSNWYLHKSRSLKRGWVKKNVLCALVYYRPTGAEGL